MEISGQIAKKEICWSFRRISKEQMVFFFRRIFSKKDFLEWILRLTSREAICSAPNSLSLGRRTSKMVNFSSFLAEGWFDRDIK